MKDEARQVKVNAIKYKHIDGKRILVINTYYSIHFK